jgi:hypothetical protein
MYFIVLLASLYLILPKCLINGIVFGKMLFNITYLFWISPQCFLKYFYSNKNSEKHYQKCTQVFKNSARYFRQVLTKLKFLARYSKNAESNFMKILSVALRLFHSDRRASGRTHRHRDGHDKTTVAFRNFSKAYNNSCQICYTRKYLQCRPIQNVFEPPCPNNVSRAVTGPCILTSFLWTALCLPCAFTIKWHDVTAKRNRLHNEKFYSQIIYHSSLPIKKAICGP